MHEASLVRALLRSVETLLAEHQGARLKSVNVVVGEFSGVEPDLLESAFQRQSRGGAAEGAQLHIKRTSLTAKCEDCRYEFQIEHFRFVCPLCNVTDVTVVGGDELLLDSVTMEVDE